MLRASRVYMYLLESRYNHTKVRHDLTPREPECNAPPRSDGRSRGVDSVEYMKQVASVRVVLTYVSSGKQQLEQMKEKVVQKVF